MIVKRALLPAVAFGVLAALACSPKVQEPLPGAGAPGLGQYHAVMPDSARLPLTRWVPRAAPTAAVVALHGFNDHSGAFSDLGPALMAAGVAVYAYDQRGFGGAPGRGVWPGSGAMVRDLVTMVDLVRDEHPGIPVYALGESMGAAVIMVGLAGAPSLAVDGAVFSAPAVWGRSTMTAPKRILLDVLAHVVPMIRLRPQGLNIRPSDNIAMLRRISRDPRLIRATRIDAVYGLVGLMDEALEAAAMLRGPGLILYGKNDEIIPVKATCRMLARLPDGGAWRTALYANGYHMLFRDLAGDVVTRDIVAWLTDPASALPSGQERQRDSRTGDPLPGFCPAVAALEQ